MKITTEIYKKYRDHYQDIVNVPKVILIQVFQNAATIHVLHVMKMGAQHVDLKIIE